MSFFDNFVLAFFVENKTVIMLGMGFIAYSALEYLLGNSKHKSLIGLLKFIVRKKNDEPKS